MQTSFAEKHFKAEESVTLQNVFSSGADFRDVVSVLPAARLIKASRIFEALQKANSTVKNQGVVPGVLIVIVVELATLKKGPLVN